jgi:hypothetical protein
MECPSDPWLGTPTVAAVRRRCRGIIPRDLGVQRLSGGEIEPMKRGWNNGSSYVGVTDGGVWGGRHGSDVGTKPINLDRGARMNTPN